MSVAIQDRPLKCVCYFDEKFELPKACQKVVLFRLKKILKSHLGSLEKLVKTVG